MRVHAASGLSVHPEAPAGAVEAATGALNGLDGRPADLVFVFLAGAHLADAGAALARVREVLDPGALVGCGASGLVHDAVELEGGTAIAVWAAHLDGGEAETFHVHVEPDGDALSVEGLPSPAGASAVLLLADPYSFPTDRVLEEIGRVAPGVPVIGGLSSARTLEGRSALLRDDAVVDRGAVGVRLRGVEVLPCVSQGAVAIGGPHTVTGCDGHVVRELDGRPALEVLRDGIEALAPAERGMLAGGLLLGLRIAEGGPERGPDEFLVRGILSADPDAGSVAIGVAVRPGDVVRLHARDADSADRELRSALGLHRQALGSAGAAGALVFTCNGRGQGMFGRPDHDAALLAERLGGPPAAGIFAAGEIGPIGGLPFMHGFTATMAVFV